MSRVQTARVLGGVALLALVCVVPARTEPETSVKKTDEKMEELEKARDLFFQKGKVDDALKSLQDAVKKKPSLPPARLMLAQFWLQAGKGPQARQVLEQASAESHNHPAIYLTQANIALNEGRLTEALLACHQALELAKNDNWSAEQKKQFNREARNFMATALEHRGDWGSVRMHLTALLEQEPKNGQARQRLARALFGMNSPDDANAELITAVRDDPSLPPAAVSMALFWSAKGDTVKAREWMEKAVQKEPSSARVHLAYGDWLLQQNRQDEAKLHIDTALKLDPKSKEAERVRALLARYQKDYATAERILEAIYRDAPADTWASNQLALVLVEQKEADKRSRAVQLAEVNARQYQNNAEAVATLGWVYFRMDRLEESERMFNAVLSGRQLSPEIAYYLAKLLDKKGNKDQDIKNLLQGAADSKGNFIYRKEVESWLADIKKKEKDKKPSP
jgi:Tfp pilus assembly protein PilF